MKQISRRTALATIASTLVLPTYAHSEPNSKHSKRSRKTLNQTKKPISTLQQTPSLSQDPIEYEIIATRPVKKTGFHTVTAQFAFEKQTWENLPYGMNQQGFYNAVKGTPMQSTITPMLKGVPLIHPGPINHEDLLEELQEGAKQFIKYSNPEIDPELKFTKKDKRILDQILEDNLTSSMTGTVSPIIGWDRKVYIYPPQSKIILTTNPHQSSIEIKVNTNQETNPPQYEPTQPAIISDPTQQDVFHTYFKFTILTKDDEIKDYYKKQAKKWGSPIETPIDNFFRIYQERERWVMKLKRFSNI